MSVDIDAFTALEANSRTFVLPIMQLRGDLRDAVTAYYLSTRAIDQIEDSPTLSIVSKAQLLRSIAAILQSRFEETSFAPIFRPHEQALEPVTLSLGRWLTRVPPASVAPQLWEAVSAMADRMAFWVERDFRIMTEDDLDQYTYAVAGSIGVGISNLWRWYEDVTTDQNDAIAYGRGLQATHMLWARKEDLARGVDFFPAGWTAEDMRTYAGRNLERARHYLDSLPEGSIWNFCHLLWDIIAATLDVTTKEKATLSRQQITIIAARYSQP
ncbi:squalene/phytoene synthase family protein [Nocardia pseudobrasiliensis]|uniref:Farnesyl-diphosphate farnesyltransferase n=1 Tax=Nocardia pseudobrasiliensis TaxID=45979 RepID=A0A370HKJ0_9NOCA|nr:squalene/phytoene synthase family protein [Nocardia pseudobrasiliensis]RDI58957.1 farnesyl-diphosphate farnesyltransferase [Nocardia pseudobrasiliensis]